MRLSWSPEAIDDPIALRAYVSQDNPQAAERLATRIDEAVELVLPDYPQAGRIGRVSGTREFVIPQKTYIVPYPLRDGFIEILRVYHSSRRWPERF